MNVITVMSTLGSFIYMTKFQAVQVRQATYS